MSFGPDLRAGQPSLAAANRHIVSRWGDAPYCVGTAGVECAFFTEPGGGFQHPAVCRGEMGSPLTALGPSPKPATMEKLYIPPKTFPGGARGAGRDGRKGRGSEERHASVPPAGRAGARQALIYPPTLPPYPPPPHRPGLSPRWRRVPVPQPAAEISTRRSSRGIKIAWKDVEWRWCNLLSAKLSNWLRDVRVVYTQLAVMTELMRLFIRFFWRLQKV